MEARSTSISREIFIEASIGTVWSALTKTEERNRWETRSCTLELKVGGRATFDYGWGVTSEGVITELVPYEKMTIQYEQDNLTIWTLSAEENGTRVTVTYIGLWLGDEGHMMMENMALGTKLLLLNFKSVLEDNKDLRKAFWKNWLAISSTSIRPDHHEKYKVKRGVLVLKVKEGTEVSKQLYAQDIIVKANGKDIHTYEDLELLLTEIAPQGMLSLTVVRNGIEKDIKVHVLPYPVPHSA
ncbi:SRPBCC domain-containing protein [Bacillus horti]|uniref:Uncharacterized protein YndB with AHSA1/START domain n=1 Tax=Caldalkalibacillus horti TaxID=77523 RepID=A0ABT9VX59_9BACI|nr:SRPBCC domain-containing protein [Bacillus horti]MDQ0165576.1 uncharacterized protein YndB with AHSA1/START domain [Bacillus horti]